jgi:D-glycero-D-manno-heptose 1,7-bisphosphate phosphatase
MSNKAIFLDRDDTLIDDPGYINNPEQVKLLDGVAEALIQLKKLGYLLIVVSNQSAVARGIVTEKVLVQIHNRLEELLAEKGASLDNIYYCPYHPDGVVQKYRKQSNLRKPNPGMLLKAADEMDINLGESWCVGNNKSDVEAGSRAGCKTILIDTPSHQEQPDQRLSQSGVIPDYKAINIKEVVNIVKKHHRSPTKIKTQTRFTPIEQNGVVSQYTEPAFQTNKQQSQSESKRQQMHLSEQNSNDDKTEQLLNNILGQLQKMQRAEMFGEFSITRLMAGIVQIIVLFCLVITVWFLMSPNRQDSSVYITLGFAIVFQLMALTFYIMQGLK